MMWFVGRRALLLILTLWLVSIITFAVVNVLPGDAAVAILGDQATPEKVTALREQLGLDRPLAIRYWSWLIDLIHGNLGISLQYQQPISALLAGRLWNSTILALISLGIAVPLSISVGVVAAIKRDGWTDRVLSTMSAVTLSVPDYIVGLVLILVFSILFRILPGVSLVGPGDNPLARPAVLVLPVATLVIAAIAQISQIIRVSMIEALDSDYVRTAILKGLGPWGVIVKHALRNAMLPALSLIGMNLGYTLGGLVIVETMFAYSGIGLLMTNAVNQRDVPIVEAAVLIIAIAYCVGNALADVAAYALNPRLRG